LLIKHIEDQKFGFHTVSSDGEFAMAFFMYLSTWLKLP